MRKLYLSLCLIGLSVFAFGQTYLIEDFSGGSMPPQNWTIDNQAAQWSINNASEAGGTAPEGKFTYINGVFTTRLISPQIDLSGLTSVSFQFRHFYDDYSGAGPLAGVATRSGGGAWNTVWEINPTSNVGPELINIEITNADVGEDDFQICFYLDGNLYNIDFWYLDDIWLYQQLNLDASLSQITTSPYLGEPTEVSGVVKNFGMDQITSVEVGWQVDDGPVTYTEFNGLSLDFGDTYDFTCDGMINQPIGSYTLHLWLESVNGGPDQDPSNDMKSMNFNWVSHVVDRIPCFEEFTSSTCGPCATLNTQFVPWCENHADQIRLLKYQMDWPGSGDPYYTAEGGVRKDYYGVNAVPAVYVNGDYIGYVFSGVQPAFDNAILQPGLMSIISSHELNGTEMSITTTILPFADFNAFRVYIVVFENVTTQNVATNGETEFHHVMMKMVPDANGTTVDLMDRMPYTIEETVELSGTNIEEFDDLGVIVFVQNYSSHEVFQSEYSVEEATFAEDATLTSILVDGEPLDGFSPDVFDYTYDVPAGTVEVPMVEAVITDPNGLSLVVPANEIPGITTIDVYGENLAVHNTYTVDFDFGIGVNTNAEKAVRIYPNPTSGNVYVSGVEKGEVTLRNIAGAELGNFTVTNNGTIDLSRFEEGIYFLTVTVENKTVLNKKISLVK
ncbi:MAG: T9SS type A sorting domain-containing protein [Bacteroidales bacterium]|nr:T9SS type A sorting domain-containing protein [Bacteroidales bacterium]